MHQRSIDPYPKAVHRNGLDLNPIPNLAADLTRHLHESQLVSQPLNHHLFAGLIQSQPANLPAGLRPKRNAHPIADPILHRKYDQNLDQNVGQNLDRNVDPKIDQSGGLILHLHESQSANQHPHQKHHLPKLHPYPSYHCGIADRAESTETPMCACESEIANFNPQ
jgi:hypothetical protein